MLELIDVSHHQGSIDFAAVAASGISGVIVKAIDGRAPSVDPMFRENWRAITERRDRLVRGSYAFARPASDGGGAADGKAEAEDYARLMLTETDGGEEWIAVVDLERGGMSEAHSTQMNIDFLGAWVETCEAELGRTPWLYTGRHTWRDRMGWTRAFTHLPLWQADYSSSPAEMPWPRTQWQYTGSGSCPGVDGACDRNRFDGTIDDLRWMEHPVIRPRITGPIFPVLDLAADGLDPMQVARAQGLLVAAGQSITIDGITGPKTREAWQNLSGSPSTIVDWRLLHV